MGRKFTPLVPKDAVEAFTIRIALYYDLEGEPYTSFDISRPGERVAAPNLHEVLGVIEQGKDQIKEDYRG